MSLVTLFPNNRNVLWDRTPICSPCYMRATDILPSLSISSNILIDIYNNKSDDNIIHHIGIIKTIDSQLKSNTTSMLLLSLQDTSTTKVKGMHCINIPIYLSDKSLIFDKDTTSNLILKLGSIIIIHHHYYHYHHYITRSKYKIRKRIFITILHTNQRCLLS